MEFYPFGMPMPGRSLALSNYRFGFNGKENDNEVKGFGNLQDYGMRMYDPRLGRFPSVDPIAAKYPYYTPYQFAGNMPTFAIDMDGLEPLDPGATRFYASTKLSTGKIGGSVKVLGVPLTLIQSLQSLEVEFKFYMDINPTNGAISLGLTLIRRETTSGTEVKVGPYSGGSSQVREQKDYVSTSDGYNNLREKTFKNQEKAGVGPFNTESGLNTFGTGAEAGIGVVGAGVEAGMQENAAKAKPSSILQVATTSNSKSPTSNSNITPASPKPAQKKNSEMQNPPTNLYKQPQQCNWSDNL